MVHIILLGWNDSSHLMIRRMLRIGGRVEWSGVEWSGKDLERGGSGTVRVDDDGANDSIIEGGTHTY